MSSNVGLSTPRGSGTSGYVQRNLSHYRPRDPPTSSAFSPYGASSQGDKSQDNKYRQRQPDQQILNHDRLREIEVKVFELRDRLEDEEVSESEIETQTSALRAKLTSASTSSTTSANGASGGGASNKTQLKPHQVHELAAAKIEESENFRRALGIRGDYEEGSHWKRQRDGERNGDGDRDGGREGETRRDREGRERDGRDRERERDGGRERERRW